MSVLFSIPFQLCAIFLLDVVLSEKCLFVHPIVLVGKLIVRLEKILRVLFRCPFLQDKSENSSPGQKWRERVAGAFLVLIVCAVSYGVPFALLVLVRLSSPLMARVLDFFLDCPPEWGEKAASSLFLVFSVWVGFRCISAKCLFDEAMNVFNKLGDSIDEGRCAVSRIVGRETSELDEAGVVRACVETVAENTTDGIFSPLFFYIIGGAPLAFLYKAVNTMDSMVGYKNGRYRYFGTAAARLDDVMNFFPARLCAISMVATQILSPRRAFSALAVFLRDRHKHESPNSAQTESVMAGILGVRLGGNAVYEGIVEEKPTLGNETRAITRDDIKKSLRVMYGSCATCAAFFLLAYFICCVFRVFG